MESRRAQRAEVGRLDGELVFYGKLGFQRGDCRGHERSKGHLGECQQFQMRIRLGSGFTDILLLTKATELVVKGLLA